MRKMHRRTGRPSITSMIIDVIMIIRPRASLVALVHRLNTSRIIRLVAVDDESGSFWSPGILKTNVSSRRHRRKIRPNFGLQSWRNHWRNVRNPKENGRMLIWRNVHVLNKHRLLSSAYRLGRRRTIQRSSSSNNRAGRSRSVLSDHKPPKTLTTTIRTNGAQSD